MMNMVLTATQARVKIDELIDETSANHQPIVITGKRNNAVLIAQSDWSAIQEALYLMSIPGMRESIAKGLATPLSDCSDMLK
jgi:antitoxin YefM